MSHRCILHYAWSLHLLWVGCLIASTHPAATSSIRPIATMCGGRWGAIVFLTLACGLSIVNIFRLVCVPRIFGFMAMLPQQAAMCTSALGAISYAIQCQYADGVARPFWFIFADQLPCIMAAVWHTVALLDEYGGRGLFNGKAGGSPGSNGRGSKLVGYYSASSAGKQPKP